MDTLLTYLDKYIPIRGAARLSLIGVVILTGWALAHASDTRVADATTRQQLDAIEQRLGDIEDEMRDLNRFLRVERKK
jgi:hypothetical protein